MKEDWKDIPGYEGYYKASNKGRIRSVDRIVKHPSGSDKNCKGRILKQGKNGAGYHHVTLAKNGTRVNRLVHRLVAKTFIPNPKNKRCVNHLDCNKSNNKASNLEWCTYSENEKHSYRNGKKPNKTGLGKFGVRNETSKQVLMKNKNGKWIGVYGSASVCADLINSTQGRISNTCRGESKHHRGYHFEYISIHKFKSIKRTNPDLINRPYDTSEQQGEIFKPKHKGAYTL